MKRRSAAISIVTGDNFARPPGPFVLRPESAPTDPVSPPSTIDSFLDAIYSRRWWILGGVLLSVAATGYVSQLLPRTYRATAILEVDQSRISDMVKELQSDAMLQPAIDKYHLTDADRNGLTVSGPDKQRIRIIYRHHDPKIAANVANWIAKTYLDHGPTTGISGPELSNLRARMEQSRKAVVDFESGDGGANAEVEMKKLATRLLDLNTAYAAAQKERAAAQREEARREAQRRAAEVNAAYLRVKSEADALPARAAEHETLRLKAEADWALYEALAKTGAPAGEPGGSTETRLAVLAVPPSHPASPNVPLNVAIALLASLLVGCIAASLAGQRNSSLTTREQIQRISGSNEVMVLPAVHAWRHREGLAMFSAEAQKGKPGDSDIRDFRDRIGAWAARPATLPVGPHSRVIAVVSPGAREGRSRIAFELARAFASKNEKTLLVDANLHSPILHALQFSAGPRLGLCSALSGDTGWSEVVLRAAALDEPDILPSGAPDARCAGLFHRGLLTLIEEMAGSYSVIVLDSPPFLHFPESLEIANSAGEVVIVARAGTTSAPAFEEMLHYIRRLDAPIGAVALNDV